jgi:hypothetical protein
MTFARPPTIRLMSSVAPPSVKAPSIPLRSQTKREIHSEDGHAGGRGPSALAVQTTTSGRWPPSVLALLLPSAPKRRRSGVDILPRPPHHLVQERYPRLADALGDLDDALCPVNLFACLLSDGTLLGHDLALQVSMLASQLTSSGQFQQRVAGSESWAGEADGSSWDG